MKLTEKEVEWLNNEILTTIVKPKLGNDTTYLTTLDKICKEFLGTKFHGIYTSDQIPELTNKKPYCILNLDDSTQQGSHWIAVVKNDKKYIVYDSFGRESIKIIPSIINKYGNGAVFDTEYDAEQEMVENNCGQRCLSFLILTELFGINNSLLL